MLSFYPPPHHDGVWSDILVLSLVRRWNHQMYLLNNTHRTRYAFFSLSERRSIAIAILLQGFPI
jgi:hypothetical protein